MAKIHHGHLCGLRKHKYQVLQEHFIKLVCI